LLGSFNMTDPGKKEREVAWGFIPPTSGSKRTGEHQRQSYYKEKGLREVSPREKNIFQESSRGGIEIFQRLSMFSNSGRKEKSYDVSCKRKSHRRRSNHLELGGEIKKTQRIG